MTCSNSGGSGNNYCCRVDTDAETCCNNGSSFVVPVGQVIGHPNASTSSSTLSSNTGTATRSPPRSSQSQFPVLPSEMAQPNSNSKSSAISLGLGIGLGLPLSVAFLALLFFLLKELRRQNNIREAERGKANGGNSRGRAWRDASTWWTADMGNRGCGAA